MINFLKLFLNFTLDTMLWYLSSMSISQESSMQTKYLFFFIQIRIRMRLVPQKCLSPPVIIFYWPFQGSEFFHGPFMLFVSVMLSCLYLADVWIPAGKWLTCWLSCIIVFLLLSHMMSWVRCVFDCIDSRYLPSSLL